MKSLFKPILLSVAGCGILFGGPALGQGLSDRVGQVLQDRERAQASNGDKSRILSTLMYTDMSVQFRDMEVRDVFEYMENFLGIRIVGRYLDDRVGMGIDPRLTITLDVEDVPALTVLELVLEQAADFEETTWQIRRGFLEVGTKERLAMRPAQELRYYPIRDLLYEPPYFDNFPQFDLAQALLQGGGGGGGRGGGGGGRGGGGGGFGGGGAGGGGGGGGGMGGGGGLPFGTPDEDDPEDRARELAEEIIEIIVDTIEPDMWETFGGDVREPRYYAGYLVIRAPDFMHRQIGGYPFPTSPAAVGQDRRGDAGTRFVTFDNNYSHFEFPDGRQVSAGMFRSKGDNEAGEQKPAEGSDKK